MFIPAQTKGPAQVKTETSISFPAENCSGAGPQCHPCQLQGGEDRLQGTDGGMDGSSHQWGKQSQRKGGHWMGINASRSRRQSFVVPRLQLHEVKNQEGLSWHFRGWGGLSFSDRG